VAFCGCPGRVYRQSTQLTCSPPSNCSVKYDRDCPPKGGCVISAIRNQTKILEHCYQNGDTSEECAQALKYVVHFFGDITQPLHCSEKSLGGNQIFVKFDGLRRNLHEVNSNKLCLMNSVGILRFLLSLLGRILILPRFQLGQIPLNGESHLPHIRS
jgi:hypothetical protein